MYQCLNRASSIRKCSIKSGLNEETLLMSWQRYAIEEINDWAYIYMYILKKKSGINWFHEVIIVIVIIRFYSYKIFFPLKWCKNCHKWIIFFYQNCWPSKKATDCITHYSNTNSSRVPEKGQIILQNSQRKFKTYYIVIKYRFIFMCNGHITYYLKPLFMSMSDDGLYNRCQNPKYENGF